MIHSNPVPVVVPDDGGMTIVEEDDCDVSGCTTGVEVCVWVMLSAEPNAEFWTWL